MNKLLWWAIDRAVNPRLPHLRLLAVLGLLALLGAQVFGLARGYACDCSGRFEMTAFDHCHGPHHHDCHREEELGHEHHEGDGAGERHEHQRLHDDHEGRALAAAALAVNFVPVLLAVFDDVPRWTETIFPKTPRTDLNVGTGPPGVAVARTTVLLI